mgnify:CR=1 FL=1
MKRKIVKIDESKCNGCGLCIPNCAEGAIQIIDGKARLVKDMYCDGLGACLGTCPQDAIAIEEREADPFDEAAAHEFVKRQKAKTGAETKHAEPETARAEAKASPCAGSAPSGGGCPGSRLRQMQAKQQGANGEAPEGSVPSALTNWPVQMNLLPIEAPFYKDADLLIAADCTAFACGDFHTRLLPGKVALIGCPKLDDVQTYVEKLTEIFRRNDVNSVEVVHMEVPCCMGMVFAVEQAAEGCGKDLPVTKTRVGVDGEIQSRV